MMPRLARLFIRMTSHRGATRIFACGIVLASILAASDALARAGGGESFNSGSSSGGSGDGMGGGEGYLVYALLRLIIAYPKVGVPVAVVVVALVMIAGRTSRSAYVSSVIRHDRQSPARSDISMEMAALRERDPAFSPQSFEERVAVVFPKVQAAWSAWDLKALRPFVSDGIYERFRIQLEIQKNCRLRNTVEQVRVNAVRLVDLQCDPHFDAAHLRIEACAVDQTVDAATGKRVAGSELPAGFAEVWSFLRKPGVRTSGRRGLMESSCPNCAAPVKLADSVQCSSCGAIVNSGEYDWVLSGITQDSEWAPRAREQVPGLSDMSNRDPGFCIQHIEDHAAVVFWRHRAAEFFAAATYMDKVARPEYTRSRSSDFRAGSDGKSTFHADAALGAVRVVGVETGSSDGFDRVHVRVTWSSHTESAVIPSLVTPAPGRSMLRSHLFVLARKTGVRTPVSHTLNSAHCPACGAPESPGSGGSCRYCGAARNDGSTGWVLDSVEPFFGFMHGPARRGDTEEPLPVLPAAEAERLIQSAAAVMIADGEITADEETALGRMARRRNIPESRVNEIVERVRNDGAAAAPMRGNTPENMAFLRSLIIMCLADGKVVKAERDTIRALVSHMQYTDFDVDYAIRRETARLYAEARRNNRKTKKRAETTA